MPQLDTVTFFHQALSLSGFFLISLPLFVFFVSKYISLVSAFRSKTYTGLDRLFSNTFPKTFSQPLAISQPFVGSQLKTTQLKEFKLDRLHY